MRGLIFAMVLGTMMSETVVSGTLVQLYSAGLTVRFELNDSEASEALCSMLPLQVNVSNYSTNEKVFQPPKDLSVGKKTPLSEGGGSGVLGYFAPWNNVVMYYGDFGPYPELYELGRVVSGKENIAKLQGRAELRKIEKK